MSLDVFRGLTICFMIIVNTPGSGATAFAPLEHAAWFGFTPTDLVFPSFLFAVGNAMSFTMKKFDTLSTGTVLYRVFKTRPAHFLIGYLMYWFPFVDHGKFGMVQLLGLLPVPVLWACCNVSAFAIYLLRLLFTS
jgi:predicted acyltransferase